MHLPETKKRKKGTKRRQSGVKTKSSHKQNTTDKVIHLTGQNVAISGKKMGSLNSIKAKVGVAPVNSAPLQQINSNQSEEHHRMKSNGKFGIFHVFNSGPTREKVVEDQTNSSTISSAGSRTSANLISAARLYLSKSPVPINTRDSVSTASNSNTPPSIIASQSPSLQLNRKKLPSSINKSNLTPSNSSMGSSSGFLLQTCPARILPGGGESTLVKQKTPLSPSKPTKVFRSERQTKSLLEQGMSTPGAPPATPTPYQMKQVEYVDSLKDVRGQRSLKGKLDDIKIKLNNQESKKKVKQEKQMKKDESRMSNDLKTQQRNTIYALNAIMTSVDENKFLAFIKEHGLQF